MNWFFSISWFSVLCPYFNIYFTLNSYFLTFPLFFCSCGKTVYFQRCPWEAERAKCKGRQRLHYKCKKNVSLHFVRLWQPRMNGEVQGKRFCNSDVTLWTVKVCFSPKGWGGWRQSRSVGYPYHILARKRPWSLYVATQPSELPWLNPRAKSDLKTDSPFPGLPPPATTLDKSLKLGSGCLILHSCPQTTQL